MEQNFGAILATALLVIVVVVLDGVVVAIILVGINCGADAIHGLSALHVTLIQLLV